MAAAAAATAGTGAHAEEHDDENSQQLFLTKDKHVFILSSAGKPIYSRYGSEDRLAPVMGVMQSLASFVQMDNKDQLRCFVAGRHVFVFQVKEPLLLVMVSRTGESEAQMGMQLMYVYNQILSVLTQAQLTRIFQQHTNFDLRRLLSGTEKLIDNLITLMDNNAAFFLSAVRCLPMTAAARAAVAGVLQMHRPKELVFALLLYEDQLITLIRPKRYSLHPADIHLIFNLVMGSSSFKDAESWTPLCLPKFNNTGFLYAHVSYIDALSRACLVMLSTSRDAFFELSECRKKVIQSLSANGCLAVILSSITAKRYTTEDMEVPEMRHFLYKSKAIAQFTSPALPPPYSSRTELRERLFRHYQFVHHRMHSAARPLKVYFHSTADEVLLGWCTPGFELYAVFGPLISKERAFGAVINAIRYIKREEARLFVLNSQVF